MKINVLKGKVDILSIEVMASWQKRAFSEFEVNFWDEILIASFWKWFLLKNMKLIEQLSVKTFLILLQYIWVYLVKICPNFVISPLPQFTKYQHFLWVCWFSCKKVLDFWGCLSKFFYRTCTSDKIYHLSFLTTLHMRYRTKWYIILKLDYGFIQIKNEIGKVFINSAPKMI